MMACHFELSICGCVCVCPFLGQVSLKTSPKHRPQGKHFHVKHRNPPTPLPQPPTPSHLSLAEVTLIGRLNPQCCQLSYFCVLNVIYRIKTVQCPSFSVQLSSTLCWCSHLKLTCLL